MLEDLIETYKILNEFTGTSKGHSMKLFKERSKLNISKFFYSN